MFLCHLMCDAKLLISQNRPIYHSYLKCQRCLYFTNHSYFSGRSLESAM